MGRPTLLTDLVAQRIVTAVKAGASRAGAAKAARVHKATLLDWLARGRNGEEGFADLYDRVREAEGKLEEELVICVLEMARTCEHPPTRLAAIRVLLQRVGFDKEITAKTAPANEGQRDPVADLDVVRSVLAALESRKVA